VSGGLRAFLATLGLAEAVQASSVGGIVLKAVPSLARRVDVVSVGRQTAAVRFRALPAIG
jgi:nicotinate-nucleotide pyrophosphorylase